MNTTEIENILRHAPCPKPPGILRQQLKAQALRGPRLASPTSTKPPPRSSWFARWWPALAPTAVSLACAAVLSVQQSEIRKLRATLQPTSHSGASSVPAPGGTQLAAKTAALPAADQEEISRLQTSADRLKSEVSTLEQMRAENNRLRTQLASASAEALSPEEIQALEQASARALCIQCVNNLKQLGLAARMWANDNGETNPPNVQSLNNYLGSNSKTLICPADKGRQAAPDWSSFTPANCSYEYLAPSSPDTEPNRILFRCPIHGNVGLCDGSVQMEMAKKHPEMIMQQDGKLYLGQPPGGSAAPSGSSNPGQ